MPPEISGHPPTPTPSPVSQPSLKEPHSSPPSSFSVFQSLLAGLAFSLGTNLGGIFQSLKLEGAGMRSQKRKGSRSWETADTEDSSSQECEAELLLRPPDASPPQPPSTHTYSLSLTLTLRLSLQACGLHPRTCRYLKDTEG